MMRALFKGATRMPLPTIYTDECMGEAVLRLNWTRCFNGTVSALRAFPFSFSFFVCFLCSKESLYALNVSFCNYFR